MLWDEPSNKHVMCLTCPAFVRNKDLNLNLNNK